MGWLSALAMRVAFPVPPALSPRPELLGTAWEHHEAAALYLSEHVRSNLADVAPPPPSTLMDDRVLLRQYMVASRMLKDAFSNPGELGLRAPGPAALNVSPMQSCVLSVSAT